MIRHSIVETSERTQVVDVTEKALSMVREVVDGLAFFYIPHTTASLLLCEDDSELRADLAKVAGQWLADCRPFRHIRKNNPNTEAHVLSAFGGTGVIVAIDGGRPDLGTYQNILFLEMDGPKKRELRCKIIQGMTNP
jgi:secondary thiamine-phosphate synthase enzyme